ncbi:unnamed protein product [Paramecium primaurelia]|uniref:Uncharacterized protein n=1 Tax=Paramecium primaurelia TaxID=5886 RepID=A0A8S1LHB8_PARPR|nr:unnamed protein product [Paramecium primaurelia]
MIAILTNDIKILLVRNEFNETKLKVQKIQYILECILKSIDMSKHLKVNQFRKPKLFIISENEAISFDVLLQKTLNRGKSINDIYDDEISNRVLVFAGRYGIIVYNYVNEELKKIYIINLDYNVIKVQLLNIIYLYWMIKEELIFIFERRQLYYQSYQIIVFIQIEKSNFFCLQKQFILSYQIGKQINQIWN